MIFLAKPLTFFYNWKSCVHLEGLFFSWDDLVYSLEVLVFYTLAVVSSVEGTDIGLSFATLLLVFSRVIFPDSLSSISRVVSGYGGGFSSRKNLVREQGGQASD